MLSINKIKTIAIVGAFDRHNYGDLLFPIIIERAALKRGFVGKINFFSTLISDLSEYGAKPTKSLSSLFSRSNGPDTLIIVAGGEIISAPWPVVVSYLCVPKLGNLISRICRRLGFRMPAYFFSRIMGVPSSLPFVYSNNDFSHGARVVYNAVGGSHLGSEKNNLVGSIVANKLRAVSYISVRDQATKNILDEMNVGNVRLSPDSAVLLSDIFSLDELSLKVSDELKATCSALGGNYICFQSALMYVIGKEHFIAEKIIRLQEKSSFNILIFAIGRAAGHSDQDAASAIFKHIRNNAHIKVVDTRTIYEVMYVIARSKAYIGTSLHGLITALSYSVPHVGLCPSRIPKLANFIESWCELNSSATSEYDDLIEHVTRVIAAPREGLVRARVDLKVRAEKNFDQIFSIW